jgi:hypothetical protein
MLVLLCIFVYQGFRIIYVTTREVSIELNQLLYVLYLVIYILIIIFSRTFPS